MTYLYTIIVIAAVAFTNWQLWNNETGASGNAPAYIDADRSFPHPSMPGEASWVTGRTKSRYADDHAGGRVRQMVPTRVARQPLYYPKHLYESICEYEGGPASNPAEISEPYWDDAWGHAGMGADYETGKGDHNLSKLTMWWYAHLYEREALRRGDVFVLACLHNGGWNWRKMNCEIYGTRVAALVKAREK